MADELANERHFPTQPEKELLIELVCEHATIIGLCACCGRSFCLLFEQVNAPELTFTSPLGPVLICHSSLTVHESKTMKSAIYRSQIRN